MPHNRREIKHIQNVSERNQMKGQEIAQHNRKVRVNKMANNVKVQNQISMDNHERFKNVCIGYSIQASRLMKFVQCSVQPVQVENAKKIMLVIQKKLQRLAYVKNKYDKHLNSSVYCKMKIQPYVTSLESVIKKVDALVAGGGH